MAKLLVSVRSAIEARAAVAGGAAIIDVKEPSHGPLGRADADVLRQVRSAVDERVPVSAALGELNEWFLPGTPALTPWAGAGFAYVKLGLSDARPGWQERWRVLRDQFAAAGLSAPSWVAVVYADWQIARAPHPAEVIREAVGVDECQGVLFDTWDKSAPSPLDASWKELTDRVRGGGRFLALAGRIDVGAIERLAALQPEIIAVRGAACIGGDRQGAVHIERVARLAEAAARIGSAAGRTNLDHSTTPR
ncbi:MAG: (5-formylfuran-3-yl)methyl phosphate synthase [Isosphaeraceae bacterium]